MGQTSNPSLRYPDGIDRPRAVQIRNLAEDTHAAFVAERAYRPVALPAFIAMLGTGDTVGASERSLGRVEFPAQPVNGTIVISAHAYVKPTTSTAYANVIIGHGSPSVTAIARATGELSSAQAQTLSCSARLDVNAGQPVAFYLRAYNDSGTVSLSYFGGRTTMTGIWVPR